MGYRISKKNFHVIFILLQVSSFHLPFFFFTLRLSSSMYVFMYICKYLKKQTSTDLLSYFPSGFRIQTGFNCNLVNTSQKYYRTFFKMCCKIGDNYIQVKASPSFNSM